MLPAGSLPPQQSSGRDFRVGSTGAAPGGAQEEEHEKAASLELNDPILPVEGRRAELDEVLTGVATSDDRISRYFALDLGLALRKLFRKFIDFVEPSSICAASR